VDNVPDPTPVTLSIHGAGVPAATPIAPAPAAAEVRLINGIPSVPVTLGVLAGGDHVVLVTSCLGYLDDLEHAIRTARARLAVWSQDHDAHPFDPDLWGMVEATKPEPGTAAAA
jgi:hypothetical protein